MSADEIRPPVFRQDDESVLFPLTNKNDCSYNKDTTFRLEDRCMETKRDVEEALTIFDQLTEENQRIALECLRELKNGKGAA